MKTPISFPFIFLGLTLVLPPHLSKQNPSLTFGALGIVRELEPPIVEETNT